jgi:glyoxylase-like metal-dependent hydrolase (beta-lactamase superfamily II)
VTVHWQIGDVRVTRVVEMVKLAPLQGLAPTANVADLDPHRDWLVPTYADEDGNLRLSVHALVVESAGRRIVVDTCVGNGKPRPFPGWGDLQTAFLDDLAAAGFPPESIDTVLCTHLHFDHVGWNTREAGGAWVPTFPNARYLLGATELAHWQQADDPMAITGTSSMQDSVQPILDAGLADLVKSDHVVTPEVRLVPTPGHSPGHHSVVIESGGRTAVITGDVAHSPVQLAEPDWVGLADSDQPQACRTRHEFRRRFGGPDVLIIGTHFPGPTAGHLLEADGRWRFIGTPSTPSADDRHDQRRDQ